MSTELLNPGPPAASPNWPDFAELALRVRAENLLARRPGYYAVKITTTVGALVALAAAAVVVGDQWANLAVAAGLAVVLAQLGFLGHDAGHRQICTRRRGNDVIGLLLADLMTGFSYRWWLTKHNRHHAFTNRRDQDPDIAPGALIFAPEQVAGRGRFGRWFARFQAFALVPLLSLEAFHLHVASIRYLIHRRVGVEAGLLAVHVAAFFVAPFFILSPARAVAFIAVMQVGLGLYLGATFITNHVGMPTLAVDEKLGFLSRQVATSRNLAGSPLVGFVFGGLDAQIEHHLFPSMPRPNLRRARRLVRPYCAEHHIAYAERPVHRAYLDVFRGLHLAGAGIAVPSAPRAVVAPASGGSISGGR
ncbi:MAG: fatty acid desaturase family protein [Acidimicrobiales bacterium]